MTVEVRLTSSLHDRDEESQKFWEEYYESDALAKID